jgi:hypothetical protein
MELKLEVEDNELEDVHFVSECARPGKPKIDRILADEVEKSTGSVIVGCKLFGRTNVSMLTVVSNRLRSVFAQCDGSAIDCDAD